MAHLFRQPPQSSTTTTTIQHPKQDVYSSTHTQLTFPSDLIPGGAAAFGSLDRIMMQGSQLPAASLPQPSYHHNTNSTAVGGGSHPGLHPGLQPGLPLSNGHVLALMTPSMKLRAEEDARYQAAFEHAQATHGVVPVIHNVVSTVNLGRALDLKKLVQHARNAEYNPKRFAAVILRIRDPKATALVFASGKMVVTGARSADDCRLAGRKFARIIQKVDADLMRTGDTVLRFDPKVALSPATIGASAAGPGSLESLHARAFADKVKFQEFKVQNVVGGCDVRFPVRLEGLRDQHYQFSSYEPELFPGLIYRMADPRVVLIIFRSGKVVVTGARSRADVYDAVNRIHPVLCEHRFVPAGENPLGDA